MRNQSVSKADHDRARMLPHQSNRLGDKQTREARSCRLKHQLAGGVTAAQPADDYRQRYQPDGVIGQQLCDGQQDSAGVVGNVDPKKSASLSSLMSIPM